jgi:hypothetical protein
MYIYSLAWLVAGCNTRLVAEASVGIPYRLAARITKPRKQMHVT